jgi:hypothetical protein
MHSSRFGSIALLVAVASCPVVLGGAQAAAVTACDTGQFPKAPGGPSGLKVVCTIDATGTSPIAIVAVSGTGAPSAPLLYTTSAAHGLADGEGVTITGFQRGKYNSTLEILAGSSCTIGTAGGGDCDTDEFERAAFGPLPADAIEIRTATWSDPADAILYTTGTGATSVPHQLADATRVTIANFTPSAYDATASFAILTGASCTIGSGGGGDCTASEFERSGVASDPGTVTTPGDIRVVFGRVSSDVAPVSITVHDSENAVWRRGAARTVTITTVDDTSNVFTMTTGALHGTRDLNRPISHAGSGTGEIRGGTFIRSLTPAACTTACTGGTLSQLAGALAPSTIDVVVEHTRSRVVFGRCPTPPATAFGGVGGNLEVSTATFTSDDEGKSVTGGPFAQGARIASVDSATRVTVDPTPFVGANGQVSCTQARPTLYPTIIDRFTIGAADYGTATYPDRSTVYEESWTRKIQQRAGLGYSCPGGTTIDLGSEGGTFNEFDVDLPVAFYLNDLLLDAGRVVSVTDADTAELSIDCVESEFSEVYLIVGEPSASAPTDDQTVATFAQLSNTLPLLFPEADDCANGTIEGFEMVGTWQNPAPSVFDFFDDPLRPTLTVGSILFDSSIINFHAWVTPSDGDAFQSEPHFDIVFETLITNAGKCEDSATIVTLDIAGTAERTSATAVTLGAGNPNAPSVRSLGPQLSNVSPFGDFQAVIELRDGFGEPFAGSPYTATACEIETPSPLDLACGDG